MFSCVFKRRFSLISRSNVVKLEQLLNNVPNCKVVSPPSLKSKGIVLLLGWAASRIKSIARYASIYSELGIPSVCAAPTLSEVWLASYGNAKAKKILGAVKETSEERCEITLHLFSGAGFAFLPTIVEEVTNVDSKLHLSGIVFDSGPVPFRQRAGLAAANLMRQQGGYGPLAYYAACTGGIMVNAVLGRARRNSMRAVLDHPVLHHVPQLYLYSSSDSVALVDDVEDEMRLQASRGVDVSGHRWNDSEHLKHFIKYPDEYTLEVTKFMHKLCFV